MKRPNEMKLKCGVAALGVILVGASISSPASAQEPGATTPFTMAVVVDDAYGRAIVSGKFDKAINRITADGNRSPNRFSHQNNLCVAYLKSKETDKARIACDAAIAIAETQESRATKKNRDRALSVRASRSDLAIALSNRGVLLAATGDAERARQDFVAAINFQTDFSETVAANLDRLDRWRAPEA